MESFEKTFQDQQLRGKSKEKRGAKHGHSGKTIETDCDRSKSQLSSASVWIAIGQRCQDSLNPHVGTAHAESQNVELLYDGEPTGVDTLIWMPGISDPALAPLRIDVRTNPVKKNHDAAFALIAEDMVGYLGEYPDIAEELTLVMEVEDGSPHNLEILQTSVGENGIVFEIKMPMASPNGEQFPSGLHWLKVYRNGERTGLERQVNVYLASYDSDAVAAGRDAAEEERAAERLNRVGALTTAYGRGNIERGFILLVLDDYQDGAGGFDELRARVDADVVNFGGPVTITINDIAFVDNGPLAVDQLPTEELVVKWSESYTDQATGEEVIGENLTSNLTFTTVDDLWYLSGQTGEPLFGREWKAGDEEQAGEPAADEPAQEKAAASPEEEAVAAILKAYGIEDRDGVMALVSANYPDQKVLMIVLADDFDNYDDIVTEFTVADSGVHPKTGYTEVTFDWTRTATAAKGEMSSSGTSTFSFEEGMGGTLLLVGS